MPRKTLTAKQEKFAFNLFQGMTQRESWINAGYSSQYALTNVDRNACILAKQTKIKQRIKELRDKAQSPSIMSVTQRKERLSEIARAKLTDFMELGQDGSWVNIGPETKNSGAIQEIHSRTEYDENGSKPTVHTSVKLHSPTQAIDLLNKMDGAYAPEKSEVVIYDGVKLAILDRLTRLINSRRAGAICERAESSRDESSG